MKSPAAADISPVPLAFERRAVRAGDLARDAVTATEPLLFAAGLYRTQGQAAAQMARVHRDHPMAGRLDDDADAVLAAASAVLRYAAETAPGPLAEAARERQADPPGTARARLLAYWNGDFPGAEDYLSRAILRPYAELLRSLPRSPDRVRREGGCPFCGGAPVISARRDGSTMEGARRVMGCALCGGEWPFPRILCAACREQDPRKLPSFRSERHPAVRIEACETCRRYVKSIDLSLDARPIPEVDDLVSLSMDLWARDQGFVRVEPGLAGL